MWASILKQILYSGFSERVYLLQNDRKIFKFKKVKGFYLLLVTTGNNGRRSDMQRALQQELSTTAEYLKVLSLIFLIGYKNCEQAKT